MTLLNEAIIVHNDLFSAGKLKEGKNYLAFSTADYMTVLNDYKMQRHKKHGFFLLFRTEIEKGTFKVLNENELEPLKEESFYPTNINIISSPLNLEAQLNFTTTWEELRALQWFESLDRDQYVTLIVGAYEVKIKKLRHKGNYLDPIPVGSGKGASLLAAILDAQHNFKE